MSAAPRDVLRLAGLAPLLAFAVGCAGAAEGFPRCYGGTRELLHALPCSDLRLGCGQTTGTRPSNDTGVLAANAIAALALPLSLALDTVLLPVSIGVLAARLHR